MARDELERHPVVATFWNDDVREALRRLHECQMHGANRLVVLLAYLCERATPMLEIATDSSHQANVGVGVYEDFNIEALSQARVG